MPVIATIRPTTRRRNPYRRPTALKENTAPRSILPFAITKATTTTRPRTFPLEPCRWTRSHLFHVNAKVIDAPSMVKACNPITAKRPHLVDALQNSCPGEDGIDILGCYYETLIYMSHTDDDIRLLLASLDMAGVIFHLLMKNFSPESVTSDGPDMVYCLKYGDRKGIWNTNGSFFHKSFKPESPFCAFVECRKRKDWAQEVGCLISLAQMRGGGEVMVVSLHGTKMWILSANVEPSYLHDLENSVPKDQNLMPKRFRSKLVVTKRGGWDMTAEEGREGFWQEVAYHLDHMAAKMNDENGAKLMAAWKGLSIQRSDISMDS